MKRRVSTVLLLMAAATLAISAQPLTLAQNAPQSAGGMLHPAANAIDLALTYAPERGKIANASCDCFWLQGGGADAAWTLYRGLGVAASITGQHASGLTGGGSLGKVDYVFGPRYTLHTSGRSEPRHFSSRIFGEALFGSVHAFDGVFPATGGTQDTANSFAYELGGGFDVSFAHGLGLRMAEVSFYHSDLPNNASHTQDNLRLGFGVTYRLGKR
jgi:hypothetical protein